MPRIITSSYFEYDEKTKTFSQRKKKKGGNERPDNQSTLDTQLRVFKRLKTLKAEEDLKLTVPQNKFYKNFRRAEKSDTKPQKFNFFADKECKMNMAHHVAIAQMLKFFCNRLNKPMQDEKAANDFIDAMVSSDDEDGIKKAKRQYKRMGNAKKYTPLQRMVKADLLADRLNRASKNLTPAYARPNNVIKDALDVLIILTKNGDFRPIEWTICIRECFLALILSYGKEFYDAKHEIKEDGLTIMVMSSSVNPDPKTSWLLDKDGIFSSQIRSEIASEKLDQGYTQLEIAEDNFDSKNDFNSEGDAAFIKLMEIVEELNYLKHIPSYNHLCEAAFELQTKHLELEGDTSASLAHLYRQT